eukprot:Lankesteria_metandrocarpae@DN4826_c0_g1_i4.p1
MFYLICLLTIVLYSFEFLPHFKHDDEVKSSVQDHLYKEHTEIRQLLRDTRKQLLNKLIEKNLANRIIIAAMNNLEALYVSINLSSSNPLEMEIYKFTFSFYEAAPEMDSEDFEGDSKVYCKQVRSATIPVWFPGESSQKPVATWSKHEMVLMSGVQMLKGKYVIGWAVLSELHPEPEHNLQPPSIRVWVDFGQDYLYAKNLDCLVDFADGIENEFPLFLVTNAKEPLFGSYRFSFKNRKRKFVSEVRKLVRSKFAELHSITDTPWRTRRGSSFFRSLRRRPA